MGKIFRYNGETYDIPEDKVDGFIAAVRQDMESSAPNQEVASEAPSVQRRFMGKEYLLPRSRVADFDATVQRTLMDMDDTSFDDLYKQRQQRDTPGQARVKGSRYGEGQYVPGGMNPILSRLGRKKKDDVTEHEFEAIDKEHDRRVMLNAKTDSQAVLAGVDESEKNILALEGQYGKDKNLNAASYLNKKSRELAKAGSRYDSSPGLANAWSGFVNNFIDRDVLSGGVSEISRATRVANIAEKFEADETSVTPQEKELLKAFINYSLIEEARSADLSLGHTIGRSTAESLPFMLEMLLTAGVGGAAKRGIVKAAARYGGEKAATRAANILGSSMVAHDVVDKAGRTVLKAGTTVGAGGGAVGKIAREAAFINLQTGAMPTTYASISADKANEMVFGDKDKDYDFLDFSRSWSNAITETLTERVGGKLIDKALPIGKLQTFWGKRIGNIADNFVASPVGETGEEYINGLLSILRSYNPIYEEEDNANLRKQGTDMFTGEGFATTFGAVAPMSLVFGGVNGLSHMKTTSKYKGARQELLSLFEQEGATSEQAEQILTSLEGSPDDKAFLDKLNAGMSQMWNNHLQNNPLENAKEGMDFYDRLNKSFTDYFGAAAKFNAEVADINKKYRSLSEEDRVAFDAGFAKFTAEVALQKEFQQSLMDATGLSIQGAQDLLNKKEGSLSEEEKVKISDIEKCFAEHSEKVRALANEKFVEATVKTSEEKVSRTVNPSMGGIITVALVNGEECTILSGKIDYDADGKIDYENTDETLYYEDKEGNRVPVAASQVGSVLSFVKAKEAIAAAQGIAESSARGIIADEETRPYEPGEDVRFTHNGLPVLGSIVSRDKETGGYLVNTVDYGTIPIRPSEIINEDNIRGIQTGDVVQYVENGVTKSGVITFDDTMRLQGMVYIDDEAKPIDSVLPKPIETAAPTTPAETTAPTAPVETTAPTTPAETTAPTTPAETTASTTPAETTASTAPAETTASTTPVETTAPTTPAETPSPQDEQDNFFATFTEKHGEKARAKAAATVTSLQADIEKSLKELAKMQQKLDAMPDPYTAKQEKEQADLEGKIVAKQREIEAYKATLSRYSDVKSRLDLQAAELLAAMRAQQNADSESEENVPDASRDVASNARKRGFRISNGARIDRQKAVPAIVGKKRDVKFSNDPKDIKAGNAVIIEASDLQPSHKKGGTNYSHFLNEAQPKDRRDAVSQEGARKIASAISPEEISGGVTAYTGMPTTNTRGEVIQGNNRSAALILMYEEYPEQADVYKQYLIDHAEEFGFKAEDIAGMARPIMVNMLDVTDEEAIRLGQKSASDTETGGTQRIQAQQTAVSLGSNINVFTEMLIGDSEQEDGTLMDSITANGIGALKYLLRKNAINDTQYQSALDKNGDLTPEGKQDLLNIVKHLLFAGGNVNIQTMFSSLPAAAQKALLQSIYRDSKSPENDRILLDLQQAIEVYFYAMQSAPFRNAKGEQSIRAEMQGWSRQYQMDISQGNFAPLERYSTFALELAIRFRTDSQRKLQQTLNLLYDKIQGAGAGLFDESVGAMEKAKAIKQVLNIDYNGYQGSITLGDDNRNGEHGRRERTGTSEIGERAETEEQSSDNSGRTQGDGSRGELSTADDIASAEKEVDIHPTEAQKEAGNYKKGHVSIDSFDITIENPKGSTRSGVDSKGKKWKNQMNNTYGYIKGTEGVDGDHIDVFLSDNPEQGSVFVIDQVNPETGVFDEHKVMYGFNSEKEAREAYLSNYEQGWKGLGAISEVSKKDFKKWIDSSHRKTKPFAEYASVKRSETLSFEQYIENIVAERIESLPKHLRWEDGMEKAQGKSGKNSDSFRVNVLFDGNDLYLRNKVGATFQIFVFRGAKNYGANDIALRSDFLGTIENPLMGDAIMGYWKENNLPINSLYNGGTSILKPLSQQTEQEPAEKIDDSGEKSGTSILKPLSQQTEQEPVEKIDDFGEKIGMARKDTATPTGPKKGTINIPAWKRKYTLSNVSREGLTSFDPTKPFKVSFQRKSFYGHKITTFVNDDKGEPRLFTSMEEYDNYIPIFEANRDGYKVRKSGDKYQIVRTASNGKAVEYAEFDTEEDAKVYLNSTEGATAVLGKKRENFELPSLEIITRIGMKDHRKGKDVSGEDLLKTFGFRGGEFGNWVNAEERQQFLNYAYDAFMDLAELLGISPRALSLGGELSIAFGARGQGGSGAVAHYEAKRAVINLTKMSGAGSLAHEWAHAVDNYFALLAFGIQRDREASGFAEDKFLSDGEYYRAKGVRKEVLEKYKALVFSLREKTVTRKMPVEPYAEKVAKLRRDFEYYLKIKRDKYERGMTRYVYNRKTKKYDSVTTKPTEEQMRQFDELVEKLFTADDFSFSYDLKKGQFRMQGEAGEQLYALTKGILEGKGRYGPLHNIGLSVDKIKQAEEELSEAKEGKEETVILATDFANDSEWFDRGRAGDYYSKTIEMFARSFEAWLSSKLKNTGRSSDYLTYNKSEVYYEKYKHTPYPIGDELTAIGNAFQELFDVIEEKTDDKGNTILFRTGKNADASDLEAKYDMVKKALQKVHIPSKSVRIVRSLDDLPLSAGAVRRAIMSGEPVHGWYNVDTGEAYIYLPNVQDVTDVVETILHEVVAHKGLRELLGNEEFDGLCDKVFMSMTGKDRLKWMGYVKQKDISNLPLFAFTKLLADKELCRQAADEYMAHLAEGGATDPTVWEKIKAFIQEALRAMGFTPEMTRSELTEKEIGNMLLISKRKIQAGGEPKFSPEGEGSPFVETDNQGNRIDTGVRFRYVSEINDKFNEELQQQIDGTLPQGHVYELGTPSAELRSTGVPNLSIQLSAKKLIDKATKFGLDFDLQDVMNLPKAIQKPMAIFKYGNKTKSQNLVVELSKNENNFIVGLSLNPVVNGLELNINSIRNVFPKDNAEWLNWISQGKLLRVDKEKIQTLIGQQRTNLADVDYLDLDSIAKIVQDFENPKLAKEKNEDIRFRIAPEQAAEEDAVRYRVSDKKLIAKLESEPKMKVYRAMQLIDGKLYPPMSAKVDGKLRKPIELNVWEQSEENPDMVDNKGYFKLDKGNKKSLKARYNPYFHTSETPLNDQFAEAQSRPNLVTVEVEIPESELTSGYKAEKAKDAVGVIKWNAGPIQGKLSGRRKVILSRWDKPIRIVPDSEVADVIVKMFAGQNITVPSNVVTPSLRKELEARGIPFVETDNQGNRIDAGVRFRYVSEINEVGQNQKEQSTRFRMGGEQGTTAPNKPDEIRDEIDRRLHSSASKISRYLSLSEWREAYQDGQLPAKEFLDVLRKNGLTISDDNDWYLQFTALPGKNDEALKTYEKNFNEPMVEAIHALMERTGCSYRDVENYVIAKHGPERNAYISQKRGDDDINDYSGLTAIERETGISAQRLVSDFEEKAGPLADVLWDRIRRATDIALLRQFRAGLMSADLYKELSTRFEFYVPLRGHDAKTAEDLYNYTVDMGTYFSSVLQTAKGRQSRAEAPFAYIYQMNQSSILQSNRNILQQSLLRIARQALKKGIKTMSLSRVWYVSHINELGNEVWTPSVPEWNADPDIYANNVKEHEELMLQLEAEGTATTKRSGLNFDMFIKPSQAEQHQVHVFEGGREYILYIAANPRIARAFSGSNLIDSGDVLQGVGNMQRWMAANFTTRNPLFIISNLQRDMLYSCATLSATESFKYNLNFRKNIARCSGSLTRYLTKKLDPAKHSLDRYISEYVMNGGKTGYSHLWEFKLTKKRMEKESSKKTSKGMDSKSLFWSALSLMNDFAENITRFSAYVTSREEGRSMARSISDAKELTVNFNRRGSGAMGAAQLRELTLFMNVAFQGLQNILSKWAKHPVRLSARLFASGVAAAFINPAIAYLFGGDDGLDEYWNLNSWERKNNACIRVGDGFAKWALPQEIRVFYALGDELVMMANGRQDVGDGALNILTSFSDLLPINPMSALTGWSEVLPGDVARPFYQYVANKSFTGAPIYNAYANKNAPGHAQARRNKEGRTYTPDFLVNASRSLNSLTGGDDVVRGFLSPNPDLVNHFIRGYVGGLYTMGTQIVNTLYKVARDEEWSVRDTPAKRFYVSSEDIDEQSSGINDAYYSACDEVSETTRQINGYKNVLKEARKNNDTMGMAEAQRRIIELDTPSYQVRRGMIRLIKRLESDMQDLEDSQKKAQREKIKVLKGRLIQTDTMNDKQLEEFLPTLREQP